MHPLTEQILRHWFCTFFLSCSQSRLVAPSRTRKSWCFLFMCLISQWSMKDNVTKVLPRGSKDPIFKIRSYLGVFTGKRFFHDSKISKQNNKNMKIRHCIPVHLTTHEGRERRSVTNSAQISREGVESSHPHHQLCES